MKPADPNCMFRRYWENVNKVLPLDSPGGSYKKRELHFDLEDYLEVERDSTVNAYEKRVVAEKRSRIDDGSENPQYIPRFHSMNHTTLVDNKIYAKTIDKNRNILPDRSIINTRVCTNDSQGDEELMSNILSEIRNNIQTISCDIEEKYKGYGCKSLYQKNMNDGYEFYNIPTVYLQCDQDIVDLYGWRYVNTLGEGSYGKVYLVRSDYTGEERAFKRMMLDEVLGLTPTILREIYALTVLKHKNIIPLDRIYLGDCRIYLSFPKINGGNIRQYIERYYPNGLPIEKVKEVSRQLIDALSYCHYKQIIHRDIKPENILCIISGDHGKADIELLKKVSTDLYNQLSGKNLIIPDQLSISSKVCTSKDLEFVVLSDFGLSRIQKPFDIPHGGNPIINSPLSPEVITLCYRPPELLLGDYYYSYPVDIWSLGCVIVEMITGRPLFDNTSELSLLLEIFKKFGKPSIEDWPEAASLPFMSFELPEMNKNPNPFAIFKECGKVIDDLCIDLLSKFVKIYPNNYICRMLMLNPKKRITAGDALMHEWFKTL
ncbi:protein kinase domain containing protein [Theileria equi strain WA]|uniref:Cyclin-dependent kinase 2 homolog n=1 Tax=Theileria equi strain WA TaxID=1537102 RepID=L1LD11_THEEQ|nr:protein kinase domain containing protein [Theileria equi strain WA]EKX73226.1 protein kinase domain containing protein [Theileria equi strain WA]|eukprot:XP_004832678.1 protein kinase domain containing protein [Theileria equi strain WA]